MHDPNRILSAVQPRRAALRDEVLHSQRDTGSVAKDEWLNDKLISDARMCGRGDV